MNAPKLLRYWTRDAGAVVGLATQTLRKYRVTGGGPRFRYEGRRVFYLEADLREWLEARRTYASTAERRAAERSEKRSEPDAVTPGSKKGKRMNVTNSASAECTSATADREGVSRAR